MALNMVLSRAMTVASSSSSSSCMAIALLQQVPIVNGRQNEPIKAQACTCLLRQAAFARSNLEKKKKNEHILDGSAKPAVKKGTMGSTRSVSAALSSSSTSLQSSMPRHQERISNSSSLTRRILLRDDQSRRQARRGEICASLTTTTKTAVEEDKDKDKVQDRKDVVVKDKSDYRSREPKDITVVVVGSTGYIGKYVVRELISRGYAVIAIARERSGIGGSADRDKTVRELVGAEVRCANVTDPASLIEVLGDTRVDVVVSCLASRTGGKQDSWLIDYQATLNSMEAARVKGCSHFVLLSAICVQKPLLEFQQAKLKFESELMQQKDLTWSIVRPTAFFKSLGGQVESVKSGGPYVMFGDGQLCACKPISEADLARFMADCVTQEDKIDKVLPVGGPGQALTPLEQGQLLFRLLDKKPRFIRVPIGFMDFVISVLDSLSRIFPSLTDAAEFGRIGRYYASESMLLYDSETGEYSADDTPSYGTDTLENFFKKVIRDGMAGQELGDQAFFS